MQLILQNYKVSLIDRNAAPIRVKHDLKVISSLEYEMYKLKQLLEIHNQSISSISLQNPVLQDLYK